jgi:putative transposase
VSAHPRKRGVSPAQKWSLIQQGKASFPDLPVERACQLLGASRTSYYRFSSRASWQPRVPETALRQAIEEIVVEFPGYGYRRVTAQLQRDGWAINHKRVLRIMREECLLCQLRRRWKKTTDSEHGWRVYPNLLSGCGWRDLSGIDQAWVADLTYIRLLEHFCYLAAILDAYSRRVVGWELSRRIDSQLAVAALERALEARKPAAGFIHHSDRGVQYACHDYVEVLLGAGARISMAAKGTPRENAQAESFFRTLKHEEVYLQEYESFEEAEQSIGRFIEAVYNEKRLHSSLGYRPPNEFEHLFAAGVI